MLKLRVFLHFFFNTRLCVEITTHYWIHPKASGGNRILAGW